MSFTDNFNSCMSSSGLPTPSQVFDSVTDALEFLHQLHTAWEAAGGDEEMTLAALAALGAATGIDEEVLVVLGGAAEVTVEAYLSVCFGCLVGAAVSSGMSWQNLFVSTNDSWSQSQLRVAANNQGINTATTATA